MEEAPIDLTLSPPDALVPPLPAAVTPSPPLQLLAPPAVAVAAVAVGAPSLAGLAPHPSLPRLASSLESPAVLALDMSRAVSMATSQSQQQQQQQQQQGDTVAAGLQADVNMETSSTDEEVQRTTQQSQSQSQQQQQSSVAEHKSARKASGRRGTVSRPVTADDLARRAQALGKAVKARKKTDDPKKRAELDRKAMRRRESRYRKLVGEACLSQSGGDMLGALRRTLPGQDVAALVADLTAQRQSRKSTPPAAAAAAASAATPSTLSLGRAPTDWQDEYADNELADEGYEQPADDEGEQSSSMDDVNLGDSDSDDDASDDDDDDDDDEEADVSDSSSSHSDSSLSPLVHDNKATSGSSGSSRASMALRSRDAGLGDDNKEQTQSSSRKQPSRKAKPPIGALAAVMNSVARNPQGGFQLVRDALGMGQAEDDDDNSSDFEVTGSNIITATAATSAAATASGQRGGGASKKKPTASRLAGRSSGGRSTKKASASSSRSSSPELDMTEDHIGIYPVMSTVSSSIQHSILSRAGKWSTGVIDRASNLRGVGNTWTQTTGLDCPPSASTATYNREYDKLAPPVLRSRQRWGTVEMTWMMAYRTHQADPLEKDPSQRRLEQEEFKDNAGDMLSRKVGLHILLWYQMTESPMVPGHVLMTEDLFYVLTTYKLSGQTQRLSTLDGHRRTRDSEKETDLTRSVYVCCVSPACLSTKRTRSARCAACTTRRWWCTTWRAMI